MRIILWIAGILLMRSCPCFAHGVNYTKIEGGVGIEAKYDEGTPMAYCEITIYAPGVKEECFQQGITDKNGRFVFFPDEQGKWRVEVNDGMGHGVITEIEVSEGMKVEAGSDPHFLLWQKLLIGLSLIWGITGTWLYLSVRRQKDAHS